MFVLRCKSSALACDYIFAAAPSNGSYHTFYCTVKTNWTLVERCLRRCYFIFCSSSEKPDRLLESPSQNCPKKRGGFQITNVEDIDEEESEDEDTTYALSSSNDCVESGSFNPSPSLHKFHTLTSTVVDRQLQNGHLGFLTNPEKIQARC